MRVPRNLASALLLFLLILSFGTRPVGTSPWIAGGYPGTITPINPGGGSPIPVMIPVSGTATTTVNYGYQHGQMGTSSDPNRLVEQWFLASTSIKNAASVKVLEKFPDRLPLAEKRHSHEDEFQLQVGRLGDQAAGMMTAIDFYRKVKTDLSSADLAKMRYVIGSAVPVNGLPPVPAPNGLSVNDEGLREEYLIPGVKPCRWSVFALPVEKIPPTDRLGLRGFEKRRRVLQAFGGKQCDEGVPVLPNNSLANTDTTGPGRLNYATWLNTVKYWCVGTCLSADGWIAIDSDGSHQSWADQDDLEKEAP